MTFRFWEKMQLSVMAAGLAIAAALSGFVELSQIAREANPHAFDTRILLAFRVAGEPDNPVGPVWFEEAMRDITALGGIAVLVLLTAASVIYLALRRRGREALFVLLAVAGGQVLSSALKLGIDRPRPDLVSHLAHVQSLSFPSGHAMLSAVTYLTLGSLLARVQPDRVTKGFMLGMAILLTLGIGVSRVYLGVHWPSDVVAGWCAGFAWAIACWLVSRHLLRPVT